MERILVLRGGALGDFVVTLPALALLRERWPGARIELAGNATAAQLALARGLIDAVHSQHDARWAGLFADAPLCPKFADWLAGFDLVLCYWPDPDGALGRRFPIHRHQRWVIAPAMPARAPAAAHYCEPLRGLGLEPREYFFRLSPLSTVARHADPETIAPTTWPTTKNSSARFIAIHPGSGSPRKNWPAENWRHLIAELPGPISLVLGEAESPQWNAWCSAPERRVECLLNRPLEELVNHFAQCRLFLGHDSGISHLAAACGAKCVLLFGPTASEVWAPPAPNVRALRTDSNLASLSVAAVKRAVEEALGDRT